MLEKPLIKIERATWGFETLEVRHSDKGLVLHVDEPTCDYASITITREEAYALAKVLIAWADTKEVDHA